HLQVGYKAIGKIKSPNIYKRAPFLLQIFELTDSSHSFSLGIKFLNSNSFTINDEKKLYAFGQLFRNNYGVFRLNRNNYGLGKEYIVSWQPTQRVTADMAGKIIVTPKAGTGILMLSLETTNPIMSSDIINQLMVEYGELTKEDKK